MEEENEQKMTKDGRVGRIEDDERWKRRIDVRREEEKENGVHKEWRMDASYPSLRVGNG
jgi:hypothetical protein